MGTRWGRSSLSMGAGFGILGGFAVAVWTSSFGLDASMIIQNEGVSFATSRLVATDAGLGMTVMKGQDGNSRNLLRAGFAGATMNGLCISKTETIAGLPMTIVLTSGDGDNASNEISAANAAFDIIELQAKGSGVQLQGSVQIGLSTPDVTTVPGTAPFSSNALGQQNSAFTGGLLENYDSSIWNANANSGRMNGHGFTGIDATKATITTAYGKLLSAQVVGSVTLPNMKIAILPGTAQSCEQKAATAGFTNGYFPGIT
jgi:hypothetical protein